MSDDTPPVSGSPVKDSESPRPSSRKAVANSGGTSTRVGSSANGLPVTSRPIDSFSCRRTFGFDELDERIERKIGGCRNAHFPASPNHESVQMIDFAQLAAG